MAYVSTDKDFRSLTDEEEQEFRVFAQTHRPPDYNAWELYNPICRDEWIKCGLFPKINE